MSSVKDQSSEKQIPKRVFIVPYRNRIQHKFFFSKYMSFLLEDKNDYEIYFSHQCDARTFNRGAIKNIGFIAIKNKYPNHYKNITFIFNDVDTIPFHKIFDYETTHGVVKHYYGFKYALGGIVVMKGADFERINGYPCYWGWGMEDNTLQKRCERYRLTIDRSNFYEIGKPQILQLFDGISRIISKKDPWRSEKDDGIDGLQTISKLNYSIDSISDNPNDNIYNYEDSKTYYVNIKTFLTFTGYENDDYFNYDLREPKRQIIHPNRLKKAKQVVVSTDDWSNIPYYPTSKERRQQTANYLIKTGKQVPVNLLKQIQKDNEETVEQEDGVYGVNSVFTDYTNDSISKIPIVSQQQNENIRHQIQQQQIQQIQQQQIQQIQQHQQQQYQQQLLKNQINKFSPQYAAVIGAKPRALASARIRLGGVF